MFTVNDLWHSKNQKLWENALVNYWDFVKEDHLKIEKEMNSLDPNIIKHMNEKEWYNFLLGKYFYWKYTSPNRYKTTTKSLRFYIDNERLPELLSIKDQLFSFDLNNIREGLCIAHGIRGLGFSGASGLLGILFPKFFGTFDQFVVKSLNQVSDLAQANAILKMKPESLTLSDGVVLISIMREKAQENNKLFETDLWTPRKIDMVLWACRH